MPSTAAQVVTFRGDLDIATASAVKEELLRRVEECPGTTIEVDLADVTFIDAITIGLFVGAHRRAEADGASVRLVNASPFHRRVLLLLGMPATLLAEFDLAPADPVGTEVAHAPSGLVLDG
jgi:anti-sigma B factor antagonist